jgi:hypothetical protein
VGVTTSTVANPKSDAFDVSKAETVRVFGPGLVNEVVTGIGVLAVMFGNGEPGTGVPSLQVAVPVSTSPGSASLAAIVIVPAEVFVGIGPCSGGVTDTIGGVFARTTFTVKLSSAKNVPVFSS